MGDDCAENAPDLVLAPQGINTCNKLNNKDNITPTAADAVAEDDCDSDHDAENDLSECNLLESKARGRHQSQAASLRISKIEKILSSRTDLTKQQRRKLQSRKNTANFRERQKNTNKLKHFINIELDAILNSVSLIRNGVSFRNCSNHAY